jgi:HK97 gp10 family phage protein
MPITIRIVTNTQVLDAIIANLPNADGIIADLAADAVVTGAQDRVPVRTGYLRSTITKIVAAGTFVVAALAPYSGFVEFGTSKMAAQPYMRPAVEAVNWFSVAREGLRRIGL